LPAILLHGPGRSNSEKQFVWLTETDFVFTVIAGVLPPQVEPGVTAKV